jgi:competence protein ComEA
MRTVLTGSRREADATADLVRRRMDALFDAGSLPPRRPRAASVPTFSAPSLPAPSLPAARLSAPRDRPASPAPLAASVRASPATDFPPYSDPPEREDEPPAPASVPGRPSAHGRRTLLPLLPLALQERLDLDRRAVVGLSVLLLLALGYGVQHYWSGRPEPVAVPVAEGTASPGPAASPSAGSGPGAARTAPASAPTPAPTGSGLVVDVAGRVVSPGVHTVPAGSRVQDALRAAGGAVPGTDLTGLNLARPLNDGEEIIVGVSPVAAPGAVSGAASSGPISLNAATAQQLDALPGVGPVLAQRIIQYRDQHGGFTSVDQLRHVSGFGERRLKDLRPLLRP